MVRAQRLRLRKGHQEADGVVGATETKGDGRTERRNGDDRVSSGARRCIPVPSFRLSVALVFLSACATLRQLAFTEPDLQLQEIDVTGVGFGVTGRLFLDTPLGDKTVTLKGRGNVPLRKLIR